MHPSFALVDLLLLQLLLFFFGHDSIEATNLTNCQPWMIWVSTNIILENGAPVQSSIILIPCKQDVAGDRKLGNVICTLSNHPDDILNVCELMKCAIK